MKFFQQLHVVSLRTPSMLEQDILAEKGKKRPIRGVKLKVTPRILRRRRWYRASKTRQPSTPLQLRELPTGFSGGGLPIKRVPRVRKAKVPKGPKPYIPRKGTPPKGVKPLNESFSATHTESWKGTQHDNGVLVQTTGGNYNLTSSRSRTGSTLPGWKKIIQNGGNATTVFNGSIAWAEVIEPFKHVAAWKSSPTVLSVEEASGFPWWYNIGLGTPTAYNAIALEQASKFFLRRLQETRQAMQGGIFSGELRETFRMLRRPAKTLFEGIPKYLDACVKRRRGVGSFGGSRILVVSRASQIRAEKKRMKILNKIAADTWLEYSFGWKPLISDIQDAVKAIGRINENSFVRKLSAKGSQEAVTYWGNDEVPIADQFVTWIRYSKLAKTEYSCQIRGAVRVNSTVSSSARNHELFGFTPEQFVPTVWELLPWSFLVDYFTNIGDILNAGAVNTADLAWTCRTFRAVAKATATASVSPKTSSSVAASLDPGYVEKWVKVVSRDAGGPVVPQFRWSIPSLLVETPTGGSALNTQWVNIAALASNYKRLLPFHRT